MLSYPLAGGWGIEMGGASTRRKRERGVSWGPRSEPIITASASEGFPRSELIVKLRGIGMELTEISPEASLRLSYKDQDGVCSLQ